MNQTGRDYSDVELYRYELPRELIAQHPLEHRIDARLLLVHRQSGEIEHFYVRDLPDLLRSGDALVLNDSKVIPARLTGTRTSTGGRWEGLFLRENDQGVWEILSKTRGRLTAGETISLRDLEGRQVPALSVVAHLDGGHLAVRPIDAVDRSSLLQRYGRVPLPPYIRDGQMVDKDIETYQTVYARAPGSVAAPTAGLHFTKDLIRLLQARGVSTAAVTLHVGIGTFRPVSTRNLAEHKMHSEWGELPEKSAERLQACRNAGGRVVAVGTTSVRVLESALEKSNGEYAAWSGDTDIFIRPPHEFRSIDALMTNFHLPQSTLLALVAAFSGYDLAMRAYHHAIEQRYRFFSYGDCMLII
ncbi:MAG: tRNA preQ1(34) S-adenosylmethionine ribosyltransferase-isomerase QueA [Planctomycetales bacterium]|nr:tRNA preQ1(34) S-adenosylmethionine ribosyltransferase-isomerase QueA [Planctomycetales bacterium]